MPDQEVSILSTLHFIFKCNAVLLVSRNSATIKIVQCIFITGIVAVLKFGHCHKINSWWSKAVVSDAFERRWYWRSFKDYILTCLKTLWQTAVMILSVDEHICLRLSPKMNKSLRDWMYIIIEIVQELWNHFQLARTIKDELLVQLKSFVPIPVQNLDYHCFSGQIFSSSDQD